MAKIKGFLVDVYGKRKAGPVEFEDNLDTIYSLLDVDTIDVAVRMVEGRPYDFIVDDEGLFREDGVVPSVFGSDGEPNLVGNVLVVNCDCEGNFASLSDEQVEELRGHVRAAFFENDPVSIPCLIGCEVA